MLLELLDLAFPNFLPPCFYHSLLLTYLLYLWATDQTVVGNQEILHDVENKFLLFS